MDSNEVSGEEYTRAENVGRIDGDDVTWDCPPLKVTWILHPELGPIYISSKPDPGDPKTHKLLEQIMEQIIEIARMLKLLHRGIK